VSWLESVDLDSTAQCPVEAACAGCGGSAVLGGRVLGVVTTESQVGVFCLTVCARCSPEGWQMPLTWVTIRVLEHCEHLGITADTMAEKMAAERE
jgi:hypothetical protein